MSLVQDHRHSLRLRRKAASVAMRIADDTFDEGLAMQIASSIGLSDVDVFQGQDADLVRLYLMFHTGFGDADAAHRTACGIVRWNLSQNADFETIRSITNAGISLGYLGDFDQALAGLELTLKLHAGGEQRGAAVAHLAAITRHAGLAEREAVWAAELQAERAKRGVRRLNSAAVYYLARRACDAGDLTEADSMISELSRRMGTPAPVWHQTMYDALRLRVTASRGEGDIATETLNGLIDWSLKTARRMPEDDVALGVTTSLAVSSRGAAREYLQRYLLHRNPRISILTVLAKAGANLRQDS